MMWVRRRWTTLVVIGCDQVDRRESGGYGSHADAERSYHTHLGKLDGRGLVFAEMGSAMGDKVEGNVTTAQLIPLIIGIGA